jgi:hypothetical protein
MRKPFAAIASALCVGFVLGHVTARYGPLFWGVDQTQVGGDASTTGSVSSGVECKALPSNEPRQLGNKESPTLAVGVQGPVPDHDDAGDSPRETWDELYPDAPPLDPPHVADPYFFGDPTDPEVVRTRAISLEDHIKSLREAGVPQAVIQKAVAEFERRFESARQELQEEIRKTPQSR